MSSRIALSALTTSLVAACPGGGEPVGRVRCSGSGGGRVVGADRGGPDGRDEPGETARPGAVEEGRLLGDRRRRQRRVAVRVRPEALGGRAVGAEEQLVPDAV